MLTFVPGPVRRRPPLHLHPLVIEECNGTPDLPSDQIATTFDRLLCFGRLRCGLGAGLSLRGRNSSKCFATMA